MRKFSALIISAFAILVATEGTFGLGLYRHWAFYAATLLLVVPLGFAVAGDIRKKSPGALFSHLGLILVLCGAMMGSLNGTVAYMKVYEDKEEHTAFDVYGNAVPLPFGISLREFRIERYPDEENVRQYTSLVSIDGKDLETGVNHPCKCKGYSIYQSGYDDRFGLYSTLKVVRDPWMPVALAGALMLVIGAVFILSAARNGKRLLVCAAALSAVFAVISVAEIDFGTLVPSLRSLWFIPHLAAYMLAYALLAAAAVCGVLSLFSGRIDVRTPRRLLSIASSLLLIGMICGAVWAKQAWGEYWSWDPKECWAAVTWLVTLLGLHLPASGGKMSATVILLAFLSMQITWYGVNYLPSSTQSLHSYNQKK